MIDCTISTNAISILGEEKRSSTVLYDNMKFENMKVIQLEKVMGHAVTQK